MRLYITYLLAVLACNEHQIQAVDLTLTDGAKGADVVDSVVDKIRSNCIYADDRLFLRRLAYVESEDGLDPKTYRPGYYGGIWQVDKNKYDATKNCTSNYYLTDLCALIQSSFGITWDRTSWQDLRKPFYSGLAASLYLYLRAGNSTPGELNQQADFWTHYYHFGSPSADFRKKINGLADTACNQYKPIDIVFVVDSSGSIGLTDFIIMKNFLRNLVNKLDVGPSSVHVGMVSFESTARIEFTLSQYHTRAEVKNAISNVIYLNGGTDISSGIYLARQYVFNEHYGGRQTAAKVMLLLTDGYSYYNDTVKEATLAHDEGIIIFAIGVGSVSLEEINAAATDPDCTHVFLLSSFNEMDSLLYQIQKSACKASLNINLYNKPKVPNVPSFGANTTALPLNPAHNTSTNTPKQTVNFTLNGNKTETVIKITPPDPNVPYPNNTGKHPSPTTGIVTNVTCGIVNIYASYNTPHPRPAIHEIHSTATDGHPSVLYVNSSRDGKPLFIAYVGTKLPGSSDGIQNCTDASYSVTFTDGPPKGTAVVCRDQNGERECTKTDLLLNPQFSQWICQTDITQAYIRNPCTSAAIKNNQLYHAYPNDNTKFIRCDYQGKMYLTLCPDGEQYSEARYTCGSTGQIYGGSKTPLDPDIQNPCTRQAILENKMFYIYSKDRTKFIHCDVWGHAWVLKCPTGNIWTNTAHTCTPDSLHEAGSQNAGQTHTNPCTPDAIAKNQMFFPVSDPTKYIHCDISGNAWLQSCGAGLIYEASTSTCAYNPAIVG